MVLAKLLCIIALAIPFSYCQTCQNDLETALYERYGSTGAHINLFGECTDLNNPNLLFGDRALSGCVSGLWLFYEEPNYSYGGVRYAYNLAGTTKFCFDFTANAGLISSARPVASSSGLAQDSFHLYEDVCFIGQELRVTESVSPISLTNHASLIITGSSSWTLCEGENYSRPKVCLTGIPGEPFLISNKRNIGIPHGRILSIKKGCTSRDTIPTFNVTILAGNKATTGNCVPGASG